MTKERFGYGSGRVLTNRESRILADAQLINDGARVNTRGGKERIELKVEQVEEIRKEMVLELMMRTVCPKLVAYLEKAAGDAAFDAHVFTTMSNPQLKQEGEKELVDLSKLYREMEEAFRARDAFYEGHISSVLAFLNKQIDEWQVIGQGKDGDDPEERQGREDAAKRVILELEQLIDEAKLAVDVIQTVGGKVDDK